MTNKIKSYIFIAITMLMVSHNVIPHAHVGDIESQDSCCSHSVESPHQHTEHHHHSDSCKDLEHTSESKTVCNILSTLYFPSDVSKISVGASLISVFSGITSENKIVKTWSTTKSRPYIPRIYSEYLSSTLLRRGPPCA